MSVTTVRGSLPTPTRRNSIDWQKRKRQRLRVQTTTATAVENGQCQMTALVHASTQRPCGRADPLSRLSTRTCVALLTAVVAFVHHVPLLDFKLVTVQAAASPAEVAALEDLWNVTGFASVLSSWATGDPCVNQWRGVSCSVTPVAIT